MLDTEGNRPCDAGRFERSKGRKDARAGSDERCPNTRVGAVKLRMPKLQRQSFKTAIIERYQRPESSVEESLIKMCLAAVSVRRVGDVIGALWGPRVSPGTMSNLNKNIYGKIYDFRHWRIEGEHPQLFPDGIGMERNSAGEVRNVVLLMVVGVTSAAYREILGNRKASARSCRLSLETCARWR
jgi:putative transposase